MSNFKLASLTALALTAFASAAHAGPSVYYPISMCQGVNQYGQVTSDVRFTQGVAPNYHGSTTHYLVCPVPFDPDQTGNVIVRVVGFDNSDSSDGRLRAILCETFMNGTQSCSNPQLSGAGFIGFTTLEVSRSTAPDTRFLSMTFTLPDQDTQSGRSYAIGYRVCRGSC